MKKQFTVAIIGVGGRGGYAYGTWLHQLPEKFSIISLCDMSQEKLDYFGEKFEVKKENLFLDENEFFLEKRADVLVIATQDKDHIRHATKAFQLGYDVLLEKPITDNKQEMEDLLDLQQKMGSKVLVCHVLRYAPAFVKVAQLLEEGTIGSLIAINAIEQVGYAHQAQAYVRGYWRRAADSTPMILAKCSHDLDLIQYYAGGKCESVSSVGELSYFKEENAPKGSADRCISCAYQDECAYSAKIAYLNNWEKDGCPSDGYPYNVPCRAPITKEKVMDALHKGLHGRCVYRCDNDVVDHQITQMYFDNGVKATLTMVAFTHHCGRRMDFYGTLGQITLDEVRDVIYIGVFGKDEVVLKISDLVDDRYIHGGGDYHLINNLYEMLTGSAPEKTALRASAESHLIGIAAEQSRLQKGKLVQVH